MAKCSKIVKCQFWLPAILPQGYTTELSPATLPSLQEALGCHVCVGLAALDNEHSSTANAHSYPPHPSLGTACFFLSMRYTDWYPCDPCDPAAPAIALNICMDVLPSHTQADPWPKPHKPTRFTEQSWKNH